MTTPRYGVCSLLGAFLWQALLLTSLAPMAAQAEQTVIVSPYDASPLERLAAREVRRYVYLRTGRLLPIVSEPGASSRADLILVARKNRPLIRDDSPWPGAALQESTAPSLWRG
jgi:hypothetical protein